MTPNFALHLSEDGISLLHRAAHGAGWVEVGAVALDDPDLGGGLKALRDKAAAIGGPGFATKLILPPSQLLYATITVEDDLTTDVARALEDRTPYTADQLSYDMSGNAPEIKIVAVARDTLTEAEGFIGPYGFNPCGFTAIPDPDHFDGEPNLGGMPSKDGAGFVTDAAPVRIISSGEADAAAAIAEVEAEKTRKVKELAAQKAAQAEVEARAAKPEPEPQAPALTEAIDLPATPPAAFSSRRKPSLGPATGTGDIVTSRAPRIAIPTDEHRSKTPRKRQPKVEPRIKTGEAAKPKPAPPLVPPAPTQTPEAPAAKTAKSPKGLMSGMAAIRARKPARREETLTADRPDPIAELAAKQAAGKPRFLGLILTGILLVVLMLFAALSSYLLPEETLSRLLGRDAPETAAIEPAPADTQPTLSEESDFPAFTIPSPEEIAEAENPEPEIVPLPQMNATDAQTAYAVSGIWQLAPDLQVAIVDQTLDALYDSSLDPALAFEDAPALASFDAVSQALSFQRPKSPPAASIMFSLDSRGLVRPSPEGALNPDGIFVFSGKPPIEAVRRPGGLVPEVLPEPGSAGEAEVDPEATPQTDQRLAGFKPRQRPADLKERFERATQNGLSSSELAGFRPQQRPESAQTRAREVAIARALAEAAVEQAAAEVKQAQAEAQAAAQAQVDQGTALALARSARPGSRPRNFERVVARAKRTASQERNTAATASTAAISRGSGPAVARASRANPTAPTGATVARAATDNNALALGKVALVGVFGTSSNRRALVRMPNGRFKKVAVGDRVDGGRVAAIGEGQLKYTKGSRTLTLEMPKG